MKTILKSAALAASVLFAAHTASAQQIAIDASRVIRPIVGETNNYRAGLGVPPLVQSAPLMLAAQQYAEFQARTNTTGHSADGRNPKDRVLATNAYKPCFIAENVYESWSQPNVASPPTVATAAMQAWKSSARHDANLRDTRAKHIGVGVAAWTHSGRHYYKVVQVFGDDCGASPQPPASAPAPAPSAPAAGSAGPASNDFNADGRGDILWHNAATGEAQVWFMNGSSRIGRATLTDGTRAMLIGPPWRIVGSRDFNADGKSDVLWHNSATGETQLWFMRGHVITSRATVVAENGSPILIGQPWGIVATSDMDRDGKSDIVWHNSSSGETQIWIMNGHRIVRRATVLAENGSAALVGSPWGIVGANDMNGDARADLVWHNSATGETQFWFMRTHRISARATVLAEDRRPALIRLPFRIAGTNDFDRDGFADILWHNASTGESQIWFMRERSLVRRATVDAERDGGGALVGAPWRVMSQ